MTWPLPSLTARCWAGIELGNPETVETVRLRCEGGTCPVSLGPT